MTDLAADIPAAAPAQPHIGPGVHMTDRAGRRLKARYAAERRFRLLGLGAILFSLLALAVLLVTIVSNGFTAFRQTHLRLNVEFSAEQIAPAGTTDPRKIMQGNYGAIVLAALQERFPEVQSRGERRRLQALVSAGGDWQLANMVAADPGLIGTRTQVWLPASSDIDMFVKEQVDTKAPEDERRVKDNQVRWLESLKASGDLELQFNTRFFTGADSREPELV